MSVWQRLNAPRNKRELRVAKIARDQERERIIALLEYDALVLEADGKFFRGKQGKYSRAFGEALRYAIALIKGDEAERRQTQMTAYGDKGENE